MFTFHFSEIFAKPCFCPNSSRKFSGGFEITQALTLTKIPGFAKPSFHYRYKLIADS